MTPEERNRLEREEFNAKGFVSDIERLLVAFDASPSGQFPAVVTSGLTEPELVFSKRLQPRLKALGCCVRRNAGELGYSHMTVHRFLAAISSDNRMAR
jgi:hypothetical protein